MNQGSYIFEHLIPINFMGGSGGTFLCNFITAAKINLKTPFVFNTNGSMHDNVDCLEIPTHAHGIEIPVTDKIDFYKNLHFYKECSTDPPYFTTIHSDSIDELVRHFSKIIHVYYEDDDQLEIFSALTLKFFVPNNLISFDIELTPNVILWIAKTFDMYRDTYRKQDLPGVCNVSWKTSCMTIRMF